MGDNAQNNVEIVRHVISLGTTFRHVAVRLAFRATINTFLVIDLVGCCCVYIVFISTNLKEVVDYYTATDKDLRVYMAALLPFLIVFNLVRNLKYLAPFSMVANALIATGMGITFYYIFSDLPTIDDVPNFSSWSQLPLFFGTAIFALEGIGVVSLRFVAFRGIVSPHSSAILDRR